MNETVRGHKERYSLMQHLEFRHFFMQPVDIVDAASGKGHYNSVLRTPWPGSAKPSGRCPLRLSRADERGPVPVQAQRSVDFSCVGRRRAGQGERP